MSDQSQNEVQKDVSIADVDMPELPQTSFEFSAVQGSVKSYMSDHHAGKNDLWMVDIEHIKTLEGFNPRIKNEDYESHIQHLKSLILVNGFDKGKPLSAIILAKEGSQELYVYDGHCRLEAVLRANAEGAEIKQLPIVIAPKGTSIQDLTVGLINTGTGRALTPLEKAVVCKRLIGYGWEVQKIAEHLSYTPNYVDQLLSALASPRQVRDMIQKGEVSLSVALTAVKQHGEKAEQVLKGTLEEAKSKGKTRATGGMLPGAKFKKAVRKAAPKLYEASCKLVGSPEFQGLPEEIREIFLGVVEELSQSQLELAEAKGITAAAEGTQKAEGVEKKKPEVVASNVVQLKTATQPIAQVNEEQSSGAEEASSGEVVAIEHRAQEKPDEIEVDGSGRGETIEASEQSEEPDASEVREPDPDAVQVNPEDYFGVQGESGSYENQDAQ